MANTTVSPTNTTDIVSGVTDITTDIITDITTYNVTSVPDMVTNTSNTNTFITGADLIIDCPSLQGLGLDLSTTNTTVNTTVGVSCDSFAHRPTDDTDSLVCLPTGDWDRPVPHCQWSWDLNTQEKIIFGTSVAAVSFILVTIIAVIIAYYCCYKRRRDGNENGQNKYANEAYTSNGSVDKPWLGYIPRPKVTEGRFYN